MPLTATDYANIQRMIEATLAHAAGTSSDVVLESGDVALMSDLDDQERELREEWQGDISEVQHSVNLLETTVSNLEG